MSDVKNPVVISVTDFADNNYYTETKQPEGANLNVTFNLDRNTSENYIIRVEENGNVFNKIISLQ